MRKLGIVIIGFCLFIGKLSASPENFDIFGVEDKTKEQISSACSDMMTKYIAFSTKLFASSSKPSTQDLLYQEKLEQQIVSKAKQYGQFSHVHVSKIYYPIDKKTYATLDLVKINDTFRLPKQAKLKSNKTLKHSKEVNELFSLWKTYLDRKYDLMRSNQLDFGKSSCPVPHCIWGFDAQELKDTLPKLKKGVVKHKPELVEIIKHSSNDHKRGDAIFILAHDDNYKDLAKFLINFTDDPNDVVRNNVMRVLGAIATKYEVAQLDINRILTALNYPYVTDRNKAAFVLYGIAKHNPSTHQQIINQAGETLLKLLKLQQPNNHEFAYQILKEISKKTFDERDYDSWEKWVRSHQSSSIGS